MSLGEVIACRFVLANPLAVGLRMLKPGKGRVRIVPVCTRWALATGCRIRRRIGFISFRIR